MKPMKRIMTIGAFLVGILALVAQPGQAQAQIPSDKDKNVEPNTGHAGTTFAFYATGFFGEETVDVWLNTPDGRAIDAEVDELNQSSTTGRADWHWTAPDDVAHGHWQMVALGRDSNILHVIDFTIAPGYGSYEPPETEDIEETNVHPKQGCPGTEFAFYATGFNVEEETDVEDPDAESVSIWVESPSWQEIDVEDDTIYVAPPSGRVDWTWTVPINAEPGIWNMVILGHDSELKHVIPFQVGPLNEC